MKVKTNLKSGNVLDDAVKAGSSLGDQVSGFISLAEQQAEDMAFTVQSTIGVLKQGFSDLLGLS